MKVAAAPDGIYYLNQLSTTVSSRGPYTGTGADGEVQVIRRDVHLHPHCRSIEEAYGDDILDLKT
jgi:hypothetical protein